MNCIFQIKSAVTTPRSVLSICLGINHCCFSITGFPDMELQQLAYFTAEEINDPFLTELFTSHPELNSHFHQVLICYEHAESTFIPVKYFRQEEASRIMNALYNVSNESSILMEAVEEGQFFNVFAVPKEVHERISRKFSSRKYWHRYTLGIQNLRDFQGQGQLLLDLRKDYFTVIVAAKGRFLLAKTYVYTTPADIIYYLLKICNQFDLSQQDVRIELSGLVDKQSSLYRELDQYFLNIGFREADWKVTEAEIPAHFFTSLNDLSKCAS